MALNSVRNKLLAAFFAVAAAAAGFIYLYVVPQLESSLTAEKLSRLEAAAPEVSQRLGELIDGGGSQAKVRQVARDLAQETDSRVTVLGVRAEATGLEPAFVVGDSELERTAVLPRYVAGSSAVANPGAVSSAVEVASGERIGETALAISRGGQPQWVAVLSTPLDDVEDNVALIKRQILIAGAIALALALLVGWFAARAHSRRLRRLEGAAEKVAEGDFESPIPIDSTDEVGQLAVTFNEMQSRLARLDSARKEFIANASHELRTPIFSLGGFVELLEHEDPDTASREEFVREMREQVDRLTKLATDLLDLSKLDADAIEIRSENVDLDRLAAQVGSEFRLAAEQHGSALEIRPEGEGHAVARADPDRVAQILRILIDNALTHTPEGTDITVSTESRDGIAGFVVADHGPGIDSRARSRVFERFYTGDSTGGSGLGLAIARELALRMNGQLEVVSGRGGTAFSLELPAERSSVARNPSG